MTIARLAAILTLLAAAIVANADPLTPKQQVWATEQAFARSMAERDHHAFVSHLSEEAVFFADAGTLRGKQQVAERWQRYFEGATAPFSWEPREVEVLDSGNLALSTGPVRNAQGKTIATFTSIWRLEAPETWRIVFDKGCSACPQCDARKP